MDFDFTGHGANVRSITHLRDWTDDVFRRDVMNAFNILKWKWEETKGATGIHPETSYSLIYKSTDGHKVTEAMHPRTGEWLAGTNPKVRMVLHWEGHQKPVIESLTDADPLDLIVAAGSLALVRGKSDTL